MAHRWNCPDEHEARESARRDAGFDRDYGWGRSYRSPYECDEANDAYRREYDYQIQRAEEEEEYWAAMAEEQARQEAEERAYYEALEAEQYAEAARVESSLNGWTTLEQPVSDADDARSTEGERDA